MAQPLAKATPAPAGSPPAAARRWLPRPRDCAWAAALLVPLLLAVLAPRGYLFDPPGCIDSNCYVGYALHYAQHLPLMEGYYKVSRLPWILPGFACYHLFGARGAYVLALGTMAFGLVCLYLTLRRALDERTALIGVALLGTCRLFHGVNGWNYHMGMATDYYLLSVLCLTRAAGAARPWLWYFLAGVALSLAVGTHLYLVVLVPGLVVYYVLTCRAAGRRLSPGDAPAGLAGALAATAVLGLVNAATGGEFFFFMPQVRYTLWLGEHGNAWYQEPSAWLPAAHWMALPVAGLLACPLTWLFLRGGAAGPGRSRALVVAGFQVQLVLGLLAGCYYQFVKHQTVLDNAYQAASLLGPSVLALAGLFHAVGAGWGDWRPSRVFAVALAALGLPLLAVLWWGRTPEWIAPAVLPVALAVTAALAALRARRSAAVFVAVLVLFGLSNAAGAPWWRPPEHYPLRLNRDALRFALDADGFASRLDPTLQDIKYWYDSEELLPTPDGPIHTHWFFDTFISTRLWLFNILGGYPVPPVEGLQASHVGDFGRIAVLSSTENKADYGRRFTAHFAELGMPLRQRAQHDFQYGTLKLSIVVYTIQKPRK